MVATVGGMSGTRDVKVMVTNVEEDWNGHTEQDPAARRSVGDGYPDRSRREHIRPYLAVVPGNQYNGPTICHKLNAPARVRRRTVSSVLYAMSDGYTPTDGDVGETLTAVAMYTDGDSGMKSAVGKRPMTPLWTQGTGRRCSKTRTPRPMATRANPRQ